MCECNDHTVCDACSVLESPINKKTWRDDGSKTKVPIGLREVEMPQEAADQIDEMLARHRTAITAPPEESD